MRKKKYRLLNTYDVIVLMSAALLVSILAILGLTPNYGVVFFGFGTLLYIFGVLFNYIKFLKNKSDEEAKHRIVNYLLDTVGFFIITMLLKK